jgi:hypothetical protein
MSCGNFRITNTSNKVIYYNYQRCDNSVFEYQNQLSPGKSKVFFAVNGTLNYSSYYENLIEIQDLGEFPPKETITPSSLPANSNCLRFKITNPYIEKKVIKYYDCEDIEKYQTIGPNTTIANLCAKFVFNDNNNPLKIESEFFEPNVECPNCSTCNSWNIYTNNICYSVDVVNANPPSRFVSMVPIEYNSELYSNSGTYFYKPGYDIWGLGPIDFWVQTPVVWKRTQLPNVFDGPLSRCGVWHPFFPMIGDFYYKWYGFSHCLIGTYSKKTYYVGIAAKDFYRIVVDGVVIVTRRDISTNPIKTVGGINNFLFWHVYPIEIGAGNHTIEVYGYNLQIASASVIGCEIYDNTLDELVNAKKLSDLNIIFTTKNQTQPMIVLDDNLKQVNLGYTCPSGYIYSKCVNNCIKYTTCDLLEVCKRPTNLTNIRLVYFFELDSGCSEWSEFGYGDSIDVSSVDIPYELAGFLVAQMCFGCTFCPEFEGTKTLESWIGINSQYNGNLINNITKFYQNFTGDDCISVPDGNYLIVPSEIQTNQDFVEWWCQSSTRTMIRIEDGVLYDNQTISCNA